VLFVGINPSLRSAELRHHYAGRGNRFWKLLHESTLIDRPLTFADDHLLPTYGLGSTNIVDRATASADELSLEDYALGKKKLRKLILRIEPRVVAFIGVVVYRQFFDIRGKVECGPQTQLIGSSKVYVLPNPSGRNAHFSYARMVELYRGLAESRDA
jgi:TDG/mug DNA glycosylase family protein